MVNIHIFTTAANVLKARGLAKGIRKDDQGRVCLLGAFDQVAGFEYGSKRFPGEIAFLAETIENSKEGLRRISVRDEYNYHVPIEKKETESGPHCIVAGFSNHPDTDRSQVLLMLRRAKARYLRKQRKQNS